MLLWHSTPVDAQKWELSLRYQNVLAILRFTFVRPRTISAAKLGQFAKISRVRCVLKLCGPGEESSPDAKQSETAYPVGGGLAAQFKIEPASFDERRKRGKCQPGGDENRSLWSVGVPWALILGGG